MNFCWVWMICLSDCAFLRWTVWAHRHTSLSAWFTISILISHTAELQIKNNLRRSPNTEFTVKANQPFELYKLHDLHTLAKLCSILNNTKLKIWGLVKFYVESVLCVNPCVNPRVLTLETPSINITQINISYTNYKLY